MNRCMPATSSTYVGEGSTVQLNCSPIPEASNLGYPRGGLPTKCYRLQGHKWTISCFQPHLPCVGKGWPVLHNTSIPEASNLGHPRGGLPTECYRL